MAFTISEYKESAACILERTGGANSGEAVTPPTLALVLGSGLGGFATGIKDAVRVKYSDIPHFPRSTAPSHAGELISGTVGGRRVFVMSGRFHYYEGLSAEEISFYIGALKYAGVERLILTNAAGCINTGFKPGELMLVTDHVNLSGISPCRGANEDELGERFFDMSNAYSKRLNKTALQCANRLGITMREGVYAFMTGPQYETPAEIRALRTLGADAVGMSTVPEVIAAAHCGIETMCVSCLTNYAAGVTGTPLSSFEVVETAARSADNFSAVLAAITAEIG